MWLINSALGVSTESVGVLWRKMGWEASCKNGSKAFCVLGVVQELSFLVNFSQMCSCHTLKTQHSFTQSSKILMLRQSQTFGAAGEV